MATGIPSSVINHNLEGDDDLSFEISYKGKIAKEEVIQNTPTAQFNQIIDIDGGEYKSQLYFGDNLNFLKALTNNQEVAGKVKLIYIDPPYAKKAKFSSRKQEHAYDDLLSGSKFLEFLRQRLILMRELLADDGSIYVHLDETMAFPVKVIMDEVFGEQNYRNWITRKKCNPKNYTRKQYGNISDYILFYSKTKDCIFNQPFTPWDEETAKKEYNYVEEGTGRRYKKVPIHAPGIRNGETGKEWKGMLPPPGKHWQYTPDKLDEMDRNGEIYWSPTGNPRRKIYLENSKGIPVQDIWMDFRDAHNQNIKITGYPTEKNSDMLKQIILASSNEGDLVLDAFAGSGTTLAVAEELGRKWIGIDNSPLAIKTILNRLLNGSEKMGDFVKKNKGKTIQTELLSNRILNNGLSVYVDKNHEETFASEINEWKAMING
ncbi:site-specific DNA-methyltransferase [Bacillus paranthracis]|uniref:site-specific DNA-methyltransferase n=1 Tax=Bacillus paranthracis TaxID=2026186 RepID=UPI00254B1DF2|nr:site-specific DNA-methyltransferase [Bacillus paranthracis]MDK7419255.1 site-specific DNA-methyltransferase [Bacillus paranthracis]MDK7430880.1 site-specific DNA-methyltransferase [Bacillus paranthracis]MDK7516555.1 site-specific DNA-methyltransferase [Bacillus paranthracis]MDK7572389.1 site-specific DNA-methyltransferase [Bacillus paranthracis]